MQFINSEVLDPPTQGSLSFAGPYLDQTLAMAVEDARSFLQGAEQILLVALAKALENYLRGGGGGADLSGGAGAVDLRPEVMTALKRATEAGPAAPPAAGASFTGPAPDAGLKAIENVMASLSSFHASVAETAHKFRMER